MRDARVAYFKKLTDAAVGPAPWYWRSFPTFTVRGQTLRWQLLKEGNHPPNPALGEPLQGAPLLVLNIHCRVLCADPGYMMLWYPHAPTGQIEVTVLALEALVPVAGVAPRPAEPGTSQAAVFSPAAARASIRLPQGLPAGRHSVPRLDFADTLDEVLLLADGPHAEDWVRRPATSIYVWYPRSGSVEVFPQEWLTAAHFDLDYQWITRVARDSETGHLVGSGIRLGVFELTDSGSDVLCWWLRDPFYDTWQSQNATSAF